MTSDLNTGEVSGTGPIALEDPSDVELWVRLEVQGEFRLKPDAGRLELSGDIAVTASAPILDGPIVVDFANASPVVDIDQLTTAAAATERRVESRARR